MSRGIYQGFLSVPFRAESFGSWVCSCAKILKSICKQSKPKHPVTLFQKARERCNAGSRSSIEERSDTEEGDKDQRGQGEARAQGHEIACGPRRPHL
eukprot:1151369-Rhodomonas_salina.2